MSKPIVLVLGAGGNIGAALTDKFSKAGYSIALAARSREDGKTEEGYLNVKVDLSDPTAIPSVFEKVKKELGTPNIVIYNAAALTPPPVSTSMFSIGVDDLQRDVQIMTISSYAAAKEAVAGFDDLPKDVKKTFIYTGNILNKTVFPTPFVTTLGVGKSGASYWIGTASAVYKDKGYKFYYADERKAEGASVGNDVNGPAHAEFYHQLATEDVDVPWEATFVKGKGYVDFESSPKI